MSRFSVLFATMIASLAVTLVTPATGAILFGQVDDFEDGSLQSWQAGGFVNPNGPTNILSGGPGGTDDNYLRLISNGSFGPGSKLVVFNSAQWIGDYLSAGVSSIQMQVNNLGTSDLVLRLILAGAGQSLTTATPVNLVASSGWSTVRFSLAAANLTGPGDYSAVMGNVAELNLVHSPSVIAHRSLSPNTLAELGIDNITAVPEPSTLALVTLGFLALIGRAVRARTRT